jgi:hypothetical protein
LERTAGAGHSRFLLGRRGYAEPVDGYDVIGSDEAKVGEVVAVEDDLLIVESGLLRKSRHAVPRAFAEADERERVVRLSVTKELVEDSPRVSNGEVDRRAVAQHYGLAEGEPAPETRGYGELAPDDPAWSAEYEARRSGVEPDPERRAKIREGKSEPGPRGRQIIPSDPHEER